MISEEPLSNHSKNTAGLCHGAAILITTEFNLLYLIENKMRRLCFVLLDFRNNKRESVLSFPSPTAPSTYCIQWRKMRFGSATMRLGLDFICLEATWSPSSPSLLPSFSTLLEFCEVELSERSLSCYRLPFVCLGSQSLLQGSVDLEKTPAESVTISPPMKDKVGRPLLKLQ